MPPTINIHWFRHDLRLSDNPALTAAGKKHPVLAIYIFDPATAGEYAPGSASRWWLHHSLKALKHALNGQLSCYYGDAITIFDTLSKKYHIASVFWNRCYEPWQIKRDASVKKALQDRGIQVQESNGSLLWEPWTVKKSDGTPYKVFTPFYRKGCLNAEAPRAILPTCKTAHFIRDNNTSTPIDALGLLPTIPWDQHFFNVWTPGEQAAQQRFDRFIAEGLDHYKDGRNYPDQPYVSRLSPHLRFGEISPHQLWHTLTRMTPTDHIDHFCSELGWREFSYSQLYHQPDLPKKNLQSKFDGFPWNDKSDHLTAWQRGQTGIPMVDAGMRELWQTGYMHNRVRMIVGSFLVKNLRLHWHHGERWFWDTLVDADLANNSASWQWVAGCGADAAPYFRIFNPVTQGQKFDPDGHYIRQYVPEIAALPTPHLFDPSQTPGLILQSHGITLGKTYPRAIVDLTQSRQDALTAFQSLKDKS